MMPINLVTEVDKRKVKKNLSCLFIDTKALYTWKKEAKKMIGNDIRYPQNLLLTIKKAKVEIFSFYSLWFSLLIGKIKASLTES